MDESLLCFFENNENKKESHLPENIFFKNILEGNWHENFNHVIVKDFITNGVDNFCKDDKLAIAISSLLMFIEDNFTGLSSSEFIVKTILNVDQLQDDETINVDGIEINPNIKNIKLLSIAKKLLEELVEKSPSDLLTCVWYMRTLKVQQKSLEENSATIFNTFQKIQEKLTDDKLMEIKNVRFRFLIQLELISVYLMYRRVTVVDELLKKLKADYKIETLEEGILGVRTKWQQKPLPQYHVSIRQQSNEDLLLSSQQTHGDTKLLELLKLDDDTRLESIKFLDDKHNELQELSSIMQNFLIINTRYLEISQPKDKLSDEEIKPYLMLLLRQSNGPWSIRLNTLQMNIAFESNHKRTVERSLRQCEDLVNTINSNDGTSKHRLSYFFSSLMFLRYKLEVQLADLMMSLGLIKGALDIYLKTYQWEHVINCYTRLQLKHKAAEVIQQELEKKPSAKLYCLLGDATDDVSFYEKAWNFSKQRSGLAQKHFGMYYFGRNDFEKAIPHLQKSLEINSLQENLWLRLGYAALSLEKYELASNAYIRYTQLEPNGFESWNNLAKCFIKLGNKKRAHKVLQESLKCNYDNWKIWENFLLVSIDIGCFEDALNGYNRLIELKESYFDEEVLVILIKAIDSNLIDADGNAANRLRKKALEMLAHLGSKRTNEGIIWELSSLITIEPLKKAEKLQKAYKGFTSKSPDWAKDEQMGLKLLKLSENLCLHSLNAANAFNDNEKMLVLSQLSSARLTGQGCVKVASSNKWESCKQIIENINILLEKIVIKIKEIK